MAGCNLFGQSMQYVDYGNTMTADAFALATPRIAYQVRQGKFDGEVMFSARNVFGNEYIAFTEPDPDGNSFHPGPTSEAFLGVKIMFGKR